jgi:uncharacterized repeat protein (TIGR03803 family)
MKPLSWGTKKHAWVRTWAAIGCVYLLFGVSARAQSFSVLHNFTGGSDGGQPAPITMDRGGNLYGAATAGGNTSCDHGCGTIFKLSIKHGAWVFSTLYDFSNPADGWAPAAAVTIGPDGNVYGTTNLGGNNGCSNLGCGTVFKVQAPPTLCKTVSCPWNKRELYQFTGLGDGAWPFAALTFDQAGNVFGTTSYAQGGQYGSVFELSPSHGQWVPTVLYTFTDYYQGGGPFGGVTFDPEGNLWGATELGGHQNCETSGDPCGLIFELSPSESGWQYRTVYEFDRAVGGYPSGTLVFDDAGKIYGTLAEDGPAGNGSVYQFDPSTGQLTVLYSFSGIYDATGPEGGVVLDAQGSVYGVDPYNGAHNGGFLFKLKYANGYWNYTDLHDFASDGESPSAPVAVDEHGNIYGTATRGGAHNQGIVWEVTP